MLLRVEGYDAVSAANLQEAVAAAKKNPGIGLLVTDYHLGTDETGVQVIEAVHKQLGKRVPAVLMTGDTSTAVRDLTRDDRLRTASKPINPDELLGLLRDLLAE